MNIISLTALFFAGSAFFWGGFGRVKSGVTIEGAEVGGMTYAEAEEEVRLRLFARVPSLAVRSPAGDLVLSAKELTVRDDVSSLVRRAKRGETLFASFSRGWATAEDDLKALCEKNAREPEDAQLFFSAAGFEYRRERDGIACDYHALLADVTRALREGDSEVTLTCRAYSAAVTEQDLRARTRELSRCTTRFDGSNAPRRHNIALAASRVSGTVLPPGGEFSFNRTVGARTEENGFRVAAVISDGEFVPGVGGGVCQASTTLYLAALKAGLLVREAHPHSLSVGYVPPSLDAMVSSVSDLVFVNPYDVPVYLLAETGAGSVCFRVFGLPDGKRYETESVVLRRVAPPPPEEVEGETGVLRAEKEGLVSESYLAVYDETGELISRTRLRKDSYAAVRGKIGKQETPPEPLDNCV